MKKKLLILITVLMLLAVSAGLFGGCKARGEADYNAARAALEEEGFVFAEITKTTAPSLYPGIEKGFLAGRTAEEGHESVFVFLFPNRIALNAFVKIRADRDKEAYVKGLVYYGGDPLSMKSAVQIVYDTIGGKERESV